MMEDVMKSPIALLEGLRHDCQRLNPDVEGLERDFETLKERFENEGYGFLTVALPALDEALLLGLSSGKFACPTGFKKIRGGAIPRLFSGMLCEVFEPSTGILKEDVDFGVLKMLRNMLRFFKKMRLEPENEELLHRKAVDEFYQCDVRAGQVIIPDRHAHHLGRVAKLLLNTLNSKDVENATYRHGPGSVEEGFRANQKWSALSNALRSGTFDGSNFGLDVQTHHATRFRSSDLFRLSSLDKPKDGKKLPDRCGYGEDGLRRPSLRSVPLFDGTSRRSAKLITVLKNSTSRRTITIEPMLHQFIQQGLNILLREAISECRILRNCLALTDQSLNQEKALEGSQNDNWATIDLKSASDLLSVKLVENVFGHHGQFFDHMMDCRSPQVYSDRKEAEFMRKFAGMGNALTFPVQSICFAAVSIAAILDSEGLSPTYWNCRRASRHIRVYGDDIIISRKYAHQCVNWLEVVGLKVNAKKSFLEGNFKESCGVEAFRGVDITPLYIKHRPDDGSTDPSIIAGLVSLSNHSWMEGLYAVSTCLKDEVERRLGMPLPLVSRESGLLGWHSRVDSSNAHKWCKRTQQLMVKAVALAPIKKRDVIDGYAALLKYFCSAKSQTEGDTKFASRIDHLFPPAGDRSDHLNSTPMRFKSRIRSSWVPVRVLLTG
nr:MAG: RNA dependent RNA polymerase [Leviviridae sp.]